MLKSLQLISAAAFINSNEGWECDLMINPSLKHWMRVAAGRKDEHGLAIFVSSTFADMAEERNALQREAFARLGAQCLSSDMGFKVADMRWGIRDEAGDDHDTVRICMEEIDRCASCSPRMYFVFILGDRYGWQPLQPSISSALFEQIRLFAGKKEKPELIELLDSWYVLDTNNKPSQYVLRGLTDQNRSQFWSVQDTLRSLLIRTTTAMVQGGLLTTRDARPFATSVTEQEIQRGCFEALHGAQVFAFIRKLKGVTFDDDRVSNYVSCVRDKEGKLMIDQEATQRRDQLKARVRSFLPTDHVFEYESEWHDGAPTMSHLPQLVADVEGVVQRVIDVERAQVASERVGMTALDVDAQRHWASAAMRSGRFVGHASFDSIINATRDSYPLFICGEEGSGKTTLIGKLALRLRSIFRDSFVSVIHAGTSTFSASGAELTTSLVWQLHLFFGRFKDAELEAAFSPEEFLATDSKVSHETLLLQECRRATPEKQIFIIIDAVEYVHHSGLDWIFSVLPNVFIVASMISPPAHLYGTVIETLQRGGTILSHGSDTIQLAIYRALTRVLSMIDGGSLPANRLIHLPLLDRGECGAMLDSIMTMNSRSLTKEQREVATSHFGEKSTPLHVRLIAEIACSWTSTMPLESLKIDNNVVGNFGFVLDSLERKHGRVLVMVTFAHIVLSIVGVTESELIELLSVSEEVLADVLQYHVIQPRRLPPIVWARLYVDLAPYLGRFDAQSHAVLVLEHQELKDVVYRRYFADQHGKELGRKLHCDRASFFLLQCDPTGDGSYSQASGQHRIYHEACHALLHGEDWPRLDRVLTDIVFLDKYLKAVSGHQVSYLQWDLSVAVRCASGRSTIHNGPRPPPNLFRDTPRLRLFAAFLQDVPSYLNSLQMHMASSSVRAETLWPWQELQPNSVSQQEHIERIRWRGSSVLWFKHGVGWHCFDRFYSCAKPPRNAHLWKDNGTDAQRLSIAPLKLGGSPQRGIVQSSMVGRGGLMLDRPPIPHVVDFLRTMGCFKLQLRNWP